MVGTQRAKDLILGHDAGGGRIKLVGNGPGRMHWYESVRGDYFDQVTSEVKAPHRNARGKKVWQKKAGRRNEALDCEVYCLHAARRLKINLWKESTWEALDMKLRQPELLPGPQAFLVEHETASVQAPPGSPPIPAQTAPAATPEKTSPAPARKSLASRLA